VSDFDKSCDRPVAFERQESPVPVLQHAARSAGLLECREKQSL